ncbi:glycosyltransferase family 2 protein [Cupriavidus alkaliphilus]|uniref:glycosyltransferase family 2 protein n=1 Tax=Cupriavidus alkaliphilus TaxID=942866 RepID=UPI00339D988D
MLSLILPRWHLHKSRFAYALAAAGKRGSQRDAWRLWAYYRLGMFATAAGMECSGVDSRSLMAKSVSFAACGRRQEAKAVAFEMLRRPDHGPYLAVLADALAPYMPEFALQVLDGAAAPVSLRAALLLRTGRDDHARLLLDDAFATGKASLHPELHLYRSNAERTSPALQLSHLNAFLAAHDVPHLALRDIGRALSPYNLRSAVPVATSDGPLVSVLMTTYQTGIRADVAIRSVLEQSYRNIELIVVDDASQDNTPQVVQDWVKRDDRVKYIRLGRNGGTYVAKNIGLRHARGDFVTCHDSDDWSHPLKIERQVRPLLENARLVATTSHWIRMQDDGFYYARPVHPLMRINPSSPLFRRELVLSRAGIWDGVRTGADSEFLARLRLVFGRSAVRRVVQPLTLGSHRPDSLMTASSTGYSDTGISPQRLAYWEAWSHWHIETLRRRDKPRLPADIEAMAGNRPFAVPAEIAMLAPDVVACLESVDRY